MLLLLLSFLLLLLMLSFLLLLSLLLLLFLLLNLLLLVLLFVEISLYVLYITALLTWCTSGRSTTNDTCVSLLRISEKKLRVHL